MHKKHTDVNIFQCKKSEREKNYLSISSLHFLHFCVEADDTPVAAAADDYSITDTGRQLPHRYMSPYKTGMSSLIGVKVYSPIIGFQFQSTALHGVHSLNDEFSTHPKCVFT